MQQQATGLERLVSLRSLDMLRSNDGVIFSFKKDTTPDVAKTTIETLLTGYYSEIEASSDWPFSVSVTSKQKMNPHLARPGGFSYRITCTPFGETRSSILGFIDVWPMNSEHYSVYGVRFSMSDSCTDTNVFLRHRETSEHFALCFFFYVVRVLPPRIIGRYGSQIMKNYSIPKTPL